METMKTIKEWWHKVQNRSRQARDTRRMVALNRESKDVLQAMEFCGDVYMCFNGVPLLREEDMMATVPETIETCRANYVEYMRAKRAER